MNISLIDPKTIRVIEKRTGWCLATETLRTPVVRELLKEGVTDLGSLFPDRDCTEIATVKRNVLKLNPELAPKNTSPKKRLWSKEELAILTDKLQQGLSVDTIEIPGRTKEAIKQKAATLRARGVA